MCGRTEEDKSLIPSTKLEKYLWYLQNREDVAFIQTNADADVGPSSSLYWSWPPQVHESHYGNGLVKGGAFTPQESANSERLGIPFPRGQLLKIYTHHSYPGPIRGPVHASPTYLQCAQNPFSYSLVSFSFTYTTRQYTLPNERQHEYIQGHKNLNMFAHRNPSQLKGKVHQAGFDAPGHISVSGLDF